MKKIKTSYIIPVGAFCSVAKELERRGLRDGSLPFDWVVTDLNAVNTLLKNRFGGLFALDALFRKEEARHVVAHKTYHFDFYHDFQEKVPVLDQLAVVQAKYARRIDRLYRWLERSDHILFLHYALSGIESLPESVKCFFDIIPEFTEASTHLLLIVNSHEKVDAGAFEGRPVTLIRVEPDPGQSTCCKFIQKSPAVKSWLRRYIRRYYPLRKQLRNRYLYLAKKLRKQKSWHH